MKAIRIKPGKDNIWQWANKDDDEFVLIPLGACYITKESSRFTTKMTSVSGTYYRVHVSRQKSYNIDEQLYEKIERSLITKFI